MLKQPSGKRTRFYMLAMVSAGVLAGLLVYYLMGLKKENLDQTKDWPEYNGGPDRNHYSRLTQITPANINGLQRVWEYASGGADTGKNQTQIQCNPIIVDGVLYGVSAGSQAFALDAFTGKEIWKTAFTDDTYSMTSRGLTYYKGQKDKRIFFGFGHWLYALEAQTGKPVKSFGINGKINLKEGLSRPGADDYVVYNTPGVIFEDLLITGIRVSENSRALPGDVRAFNVHTGKPVWTFQTIPEDGDFGSETWPQGARQNNGGANSWMGMAIDRKNKIVYVPTGSAAFDFYGGDRKGSNLFANCLIALNARTGKRIWHYQIVHHDIWDRDLPAPPNLLSIKRDKEQVEAVAQVTKQGYVFVFNRLTGQPLFEVEERPVAGSDMPGESAHPTQPFPLKPAPFTRQSFTKKDVNKEVADSNEVFSLLEASRTGSAYIPVTRQRTIIFPGSDGGAQWGGAAVDDEGIMYVPAKEIPVFTSLIDAPKQHALTSGKKLYQLHCAACHGDDLKGDHSGANPSLQNISGRWSGDQLHSLLKKGRGMMPAFAHLPEKERDGIVSFIRNEKQKSIPIDATTSKSKASYIHTGYNRWYDKNGYPVNSPPWGTLTAINLHTGEHLWQAPLGTYPALVQKGLPPTGTDNYGGPLVTASGLVFIAATPDKQFKAFDKLNGKILWQAELPAAGYATPSTYEARGKQFIVIACGGGKLRSKSGDKYVAFALQP